MSHFLFLHGSWHGAWAWHKVLPIVRARGHSADAIDLPGRGRAPRLRCAVSLDRMVDAAERALPADRPTVVVAHSRYGIVASSLAERAPQRIARTVYLASFMLADGRRVLDYVPDPDSLLNGHIDINRLGLWDWLRPSIYREALYADCSHADVELARALLVREPVRPALTRVRLTDSRYGRVPRAYIRLTQDRAVSPALQDRLIGETGAARVESIAASHSAYFSKPEKLVETLLKVAQP